MGPYLRSKVPVMIEGNKTGGGDKIKGCCNSSRWDDYQLACQKRKGEKWMDSRYTYGNGYLREWWRRCGERTRRVSQQWIQISNLKQWSCLVLGGEGMMRGWDGWHQWINGEFEQALQMVKWTGNPDVLQSMGSQTAEYFTERLRVNMLEGFRWHEW